MAGIQLSEGYFDFDEVGPGVILRGSHPMRDLASRIAGLPTRTLGHVSTVLNVDKNVNGPIGRAIERTLGR